MDKETERLAFLRKIEQSPWDDETPRMIFSDWLLEHDEPEEAERQRQMVPSMRWLRDWAFDHSSDYEFDGHSGGALTYEEMIEAGHIALKDGYGAGSPDYHAETAMQDVAVCREYWKHWETVTGIKVPDDKKDESVFTCCY